MADTAAPPSQAEWEQFQAWQKGDAARKAGAEAAKMSGPEVLHRLVDGALVWRHEGERNAAHAAITDAFPEKAAAQPADTASGPVPYVAV